MFCPKCGTQNPDTGKFCRSCGTDLGNVSRALTSPVQQEQPIVDHKGRPISLERAIMKMFGGFAFIAVATALAVTGAGRGWWFWLLIPAFMSIGTGVAQYVRLKSTNRALPPYNPVISNSALGGRDQSALPPNQTNYVEPESRFKTGDLVPPSVTDNTTRHLEMDSEGQTMALPKK
jgi:hypothetical protein